MSEATRATLAVEHLFRLTTALELSPAAAVGAGGQGDRRAATVSGGSFEGPRLRGVVAAPSGDWLTIRADGSFQLDVRLLLHTEDGAGILMQAKGVGVVTDGVVKVHTAPQFETGDARYAWLNRIQAVAIGSAAPGGVVYEVYALI